MAEIDFSQGTFPWDPILGTRPRGFLDEPNLHGEFEGRKTYLEYCHCGNPNCKALVSRYVDNSEVCHKQTIALREEVALLFDNFVKMRTALEDLRQSRYLYEFSLINEPEHRQEVWKQLQLANRYVSETLMSIARLRALLETTGVVYFYISQEADGIYEKYRIEACPVLSIMLDQERLSTPALMSGLEEDDPAKKIVDEMPEADGFYDTDLLRQLFNGKIGNTDENLTS